MNSYEARRPRRDNIDVIGGVLDKDGKGCGITVSINGEEFFTGIYLGIPRRMEYLREYESGKRRCYDRIIEQKILKKVREAIKDGRIESSGGFND